MGRALSGDLRVRVSKASQAGLSARGAAAWFGGAVRCGAIDRDPLDKSGRKPVRWSLDRPVVDAGRALMGMKASSWA